MASRNGPIPRFTSIPRGVRVIAVDDLPESSIPTSRYERSPEIKEEHQENPGSNGPEPDSNGGGANLDRNDNEANEHHDLTGSDIEDSVPGADAEDQTSQSLPDAAEDEVEFLGAIKKEPGEEAVIDLTNETDMQDVSSEILHTPAESVQEDSQPVEQLDLGNSIFGNRKNQIGGHLSEEDYKAMIKQQQDYVSIFAAAKEFPTSQLDEGDEQDIPVDRPQAEDFFILKARYKASKKAYEDKVANHDITAEDEVEFNKIEREYNSRKLEVEELALLEIDKTEGIKKKSKKRAADSEAGRLSKKPRKNARKGNTAKRTNWQHNSFNHFSTAQPNLVDDAEAAEALGQEVALGTSFTHRSQVLRSIRKNATAESAKIAAMDTRRLDEALKHFTTSTSVEWTEQGGVVRGMETPLEAYQIINVGWMRQRERGSDLPRGGILADQMGLGKTVQILAVIVNGRPLKQRSDTDITTTLVVVPSSLMSQWKSEIADHTKKDTTRRRWGLGRVHQFKDSESERWDADDFRLYDVILTSYYDVMKSWPECKYPDDTPEHERAQHVPKVDFEKRGPLHRFRFLRVVLDEGHKIRNSTSQTSIACCHLIADHKWILTGTPLVNGASDLYAAMTFIGHPRICSMTHESFKLRYCNKNDRMSWDNLSTELTSHMTRWTHKDSFAGKRLVDLPKPRSRSLAVRFTPLERGVYETVRTRFRQRAHKLAEDGNTQTTRMNILALITLLRQMTAHPLMLQTKILDYLEPEDFDKLEAIVRKEAEKGETGASLIRSLRSVIQIQRGIRSSNATVRARESSADSLDELQQVERLVQPKNLDPITDIQDCERTGKRHGKDIDYMDFLKAFKTSSNIHILKERSKCCKCTRPADQPRITGCGHIYCRVHLEDLMHEAAQDQSRGQSRKGKNHKVKCLECGEEIHKNESMDLEDAAKPRYMGQDESVIPSTKTLAIKSQVLDWLDPVTGDPEAKIIIFTQWIPFVRIISAICEVEGWGYTTLHGSLKSSTKTTNIARFKKDPNIRVLVATLLTGGVGLNLTCASRVLNVDPYWNDAGEIQAFSRIYRIGQEKETEFVNLVTVNSIDERLVAIKKRKTDEINKVHKGHKGAVLQNLLQMLDNPESDGDAGEGGDSVGDDDV